MAAFPARSRGGYDSRLILAHLRRRGLNPRLIVYGHDDENTRTARTIAAGESIALDIVDPSEEVVPQETFREVVHRNFLHADGYFHDGIFGSDLEIHERINRTAGGTIFLHGGGGEIFRNFFLLPDGTYTARDIVRVMYAKYDPRVCASGFDKHRYEAAIVAKIHRVLGSTAPRIDRQAIEWLYPNFRCHAWFGRESSLNNAAGASLMPFYERALTDFAATIPVVYKDFGSFQAELIARADRKLASYGSQYGHGFLPPVPFQRCVQDHIKTRMPPSVRPWLYALREGGRKDTGDVHVSARYVTEVFGRELHPVTRMFNLNAICDLHIKSRVMSVAYLANWLSA
jgi:asparagine synthase (glutamine-hydrolysing)